MKKVPVSGESNCWDSVMSASTSSRAPVTAWTIPFWLGQDRVRTMPWSVAAVVGEDGEDMAAFQRSEDRGLPPVCTHGRAVTAVFHQCSLRQERYDVRAPIRL